MDPLVIARYGIAAAERRFEASASRLVRAGVDADVDLARETVEMVQARHQFSASLQVVRFADEMWRSLLDIQARR